MPLPTTRRKTHLISTNIPTTDERRRSWMRNFAHAIARNPHTYRLTEDDAAKLLDHFNAYDEALTRSRNPSTRTSVAIRTKNSTRGTALRLFREYANQIKANPAISNADMISLGFRVPR